MQAKHITHKENVVLGMDNQKLIKEGMKKEVGLDKVKIKKYFFLKVNVHKDSKGRSAEKSSLESLPNQQEHRCPWSPSQFKMALRNS